MSLRGFVSGSSLFASLAVAVAACFPIGGGSSSSASGTRGTGGAVASSSSAGTGAGGRDAGPLTCPAPEDWRQSDGGTITCDAHVGHPSPLPECSADWPCNAGSSSPITTRFTPPKCVTSNKNQPQYDDGPPLTWADPVTGGQRAACVYVPPAATPSAPLPLLVYLHGSGSSADVVYDATSLRTKATSFVLSGDAARQGFVLAAQQGVNLHQPYYPDFEGSHEDTLFRDLGSPSCNPDIRNLDWLIDHLVAAGNVDPQRIYVTGHSNGATFAMLYAIARHSTATPGGNRVAAASVYAGADPFNNVVASQSPSCALDPYPTSTVPIQIVHRACDALVACDEAQRAMFMLPPGDAVETWVPALGSMVGDPTVSDVLIDGLGNPASSCAASCGLAVGTVNHLLWPDGISDANHQDWETTMLGFLHDHPG